MPSVWANSALVIMDDDTVDTALHLAWPMLSSAGYKEVRGHVPFHGNMHESFNASLLQFSNLKYWLLAVSGGSDSLAMLHMTHEFIANRARSPRVIVVSVDHDECMADPFATSVGKQHAIRFGFGFVAKNGLTTQPLI